MLKTCGALLMLICLYAFEEGSDLVFIQGFLIGLVTYFSEALFSFAMEIPDKKDLNATQSNNVKA